MKLSGRIMADRCHLNEPWQIRRRVDLRSIASDFARVEP
jgi:hypothetical protein